MSTTRQEEEKQNIFTFLGNFLRTKGWFDEGLPVRFLPRVLFVAALMIFYIGNTHFAERTIRKIEKLKVRVDDLRADYTTLKADLMYSSKQSEVARRVSALGLEESLQPPLKLKVEKNEY